MYLKKSKTAASLVRQSLSLSISMEFPSSFFFGVADADLQVIGEDNTIREEQSEKTMWYDFAEHSGKCHNNDSPAIGIDRYHKWNDDIELMKHLGVRHYRTSISMSRILHKDGSVNTKAVAWYRNYFAALQKAGIHIYATLYHWELPYYLHETGGWKNPKTVDVFVRHATSVANELGEYIDEYFILNEPWCASLLSYHLGIHAPGETNVAGALLAAHHLLLAQGRAYQAIRRVQPNANISTVVNTETAYPYSVDPKDVIAATRSDGYFNRWFLDPLFLGSYPDDMVELYGSAMPHISAADMKEIHIGKDLHTLGINYYCGRLIRYDAHAELGYTAVLLPNGPTNDLGWPICVPPVYPEGFFDMLTQIWNSYSTHGLRHMYITENGMALRSDTASSPIADTRRIEYVREHLRQVHKAIEAGVPVDGYFAWTFMDNYEWAEGYRPDSCFGMVYVDRQTLERSPKQSALWYSEVINSKRI